MHTIQKIKMHFCCAFEKGSWKWGAHNYINKLIGVHKLSSSTQTLTKWFVCNVQSQNEHQQWQYTEEK